MTKPMTLVEYKEQHIRPLQLGAMLYIKDKHNKQKYIAIVVAIPNIGRYGLVSIDDGCYWGCATMDELLTINDLEKQMWDDFEIELVYDKSVRSALYSILGINGK